MKNLIKQTKKELKAAIKSKEYNDAELLTRTLYTLETIKANGK